MKVIAVKYIWLISLIISIPFIGTAQSDSSEHKKKNYPSLSFNYHYGNIIPTNDFVKGENQFGEPMKRYQSGSLKLGWQNPGYADWQKVYRGPYYGVGLFVGDLYTRISNRQVIIICRFWNLCQTSSVWQF